MEGGIHRQSKPRQTESGLARGRMRSRLRCRVLQAGIVRKVIATYICLFLCCGTVLGKEEASRIVLLANAEDPDSLRIAEHYAKRRGVPRENIISLSMPKAETITWREFVLSIWQPLQDELMKGEWIEGIPMKLYDDLGRRKIAFSGHRLSYLVVCRGVPLRIKHDPALLREVKGFPNTAQLKTNRSAVDSELSLLAVGNYNINAFIPNPIYRKKEPATLQLETIIRVSRLDAPTADRVISLIDETLEAESKGLIGRAYVDIKGRYERGEKWLERVGETFESQYFSTEIKEDKGTFPIGVRMDAPALYAGWYSGNVNGPFKLPGFRFSPGAIAIHIHSYSASTLRSDRKAWCGPFLARGAAVTCGAVFEPYLDFMHRPDMFFAALSEGATVGEAAYYSLSVLSWQNVLIGDPLYRPFKKTLTEQWMNRDELSARAVPYVTLRELLRLEAAGLVDDAIVLARREQRERPSLPVGVALAKMLTAKGDIAGAARAVGFAQYLKRVKSNDWALLLSTTKFLTANRDHQEALKIYKNLLAIRAVPASLKLKWMRQGTKVANAAGNMKQAIRWEGEITRLSAERKK